MLGPHRRPPRGVYKRVYDGGISQQHRFTRLQLLAGLVFLWSFVFLAGYISMVINRYLLWYWYKRQLNEPSLAPPEWMLVPGWLVTSFFPAFCTWIVWGSGWRDHLFKLVTAGGHFGLTLLWPDVLFGRRNLTGGVVVMAFALLTGGYTAWLYYHARKPAGVLLLPYLMILVYILAFSIELQQLN